MKEVKRNEFGKTVVFLKKGEDYPGTIYITGKQGYYLVSPSDRPFEIEYLGAVKPCEEYLEQRL